MILFLNTSKEKQLDVFLIDNNKIIGHKSLKDDFKVSENLLKLIKNLLSENKIKSDPAAQFGYHRRINCFG